MPRRGERIGDAYVRIRADGERLGQDVADGFDDADPAIRAAGEEGAKTYRKGFDDQIERDKANWAKTMGKLNESLGRLNAQANFIDSDRILKDLRTRFVKQFGDQVGGRMAAILTDRLQRGLIDGMSGLEDLLESNTGLRRLAAQATEDFLREQEHMYDEAYKMNEAFNKKRVEADLKLRQDLDKELDLYLRDLGDMYEAAYAMNEDFNRRRAALDQKLREDRDKEFDLEVGRLNMLEQAYRLNEKFDAQRLGRFEERVKKMDESVRRLAEGNRIWSDSIKDTRGQIAEMEKTLARLNERGLITDKQTRDLERHLSRTRLQLIRIHPNIDETNRKFKDMGDTIGRLTGRGSRNNFLNIVGSLNRGMFNLFRTITIGGVRATATMISFAKALPTLNAKDFAELGKTIGGNLANLIPTLIAAGVAMSLLATFAGVLVAALSGLAAIITGLAAALTFALLGALSAVAGAMLPLAASVGVVVAAFQSLDDAQKEALKADLKPLTNAFRRLGDVAGKTLFRDVDIWAKSLAPMVRRFTPAIRGISRSLRDVITQAVEGMSKGSVIQWNGKVNFAVFTKRLNDFLPGATRSLTEAFVNTLEGLGGVFVAMIPMLERFFGWLVKITDEFSDWANSAEGQKELKNFFKEAGDAAKDVGDFLEAAVGWMSELFSQTQDEGASWFREMAKDIEDTIDWLQSPEGKAAIEDWIEFGEDMGKALGDFADAIQELFDALDNPQFRQLVTLIIDLMAAAIQATANLVGGFMGQITATKTAFTEIHSISGRIKDLISQAFSISPRDIFGSPLRTAERFAGLIARIFTQLTRLPVVGPLFRPVEAAARGFAGVIGRIASAIRGLPAARAAMFSVASAAARLLWERVQDVLTSLRNVIALKFVIPGVDAVKGLFEGLRGVIQDIIDLISQPRTLTINVVKKGLSPGSVLGGLGSLLPGDAAGDIVEGVRGLGEVRRIGEDGPEAIVPLNRPLSKVDPSVRGLSAVAQGLAGPGGGRSITVPQIIVNEAADGKATAQEMLNLLVGQAY